MIKSPKDIKWKKKGKNYLTDVNTLEDFLYLMYLVYTSCDKMKRKFKIDVTLCKKTKSK